MDSNASRTNDSEADEISGVDYVDPDGEPPHRIPTGSSKIQLYAKFCDVLITKIVLTIQTGI